MPVQAQVLVIDDDVNITTSLQRALSYAGFGVTVAGDGVSGLEKALARPPDVVVVDVMMHGLDGLEVARRLRAESGVPILMLSARDLVQDRVRGLECGADDYLVKPFALEELIARLRALLRRGGPSEARVLQFSDMIVDPSAREVRRGDRGVELTAREFDLLTAFIRHPRQVLTRDQLMEFAWGRGYDAESKVLEVYVRYLREKLEAGGEPRLIQTLRGVGYVLRETRV